MKRKLHPEEHRIMDKLVEGGWKVRQMHPDEAGTSDIDNNDLAIITIDAGNVEHARDSALLCNEAVKTKPTMLFVYGINGLIDDPRECDEIPAAALVLRTLYTTLSREAFHRFALDQQAMMLVASGIGERLSKRQLSVPMELVKNPGLITRWGR